MSWPWVISSSPLSSSVVLLQLRRELQLLLLLSRQLHPLSLQQVIPDPLLFLGVLSRWRMVGLALVQGAASAVVGEGLEWTSALAASVSDTPCIGDAAVTAIANDIIARFFFKKTSICFASLVYSYLQNDKTLS